MNLLHQPAAATVYRNAPSDPAVPDARPTLARLRQRGMLRVGFIPDALPFAFFNSRGDLVGFDIELAHHLASELSVRLEFVPIDRGRMEEQLGGGYCDIVMSGVAVTTSRAATLLFSNSYLDETFALVVPDYAREHFSSWSAIEARPATTIAVPNVPYYIDKLRERLPRARVTLVDDLGAAFAQPDPAVDAIALPAERGSAWTLLYPQFTVVVPEPGIVKVPLAYAIARHDDAFASFINTWIDLKRKDGTMETLYNYWVLGREVARRQPRWSIIHDVLHWVD